MGRHSDADRNLLLGLLALQNNFVDHATLIDVIKRWVADKARPLGPILAERGALSAARLALLEALIEEHLKLHRGDPRLSLQALGSAGSVREELLQVADTDLQAS